MEKKFRPAFSYDFLTPVYDLLTELGGYGKSFKKKVLAQSRIKPRDRVLDIGSGTGTLILEGKKMFAGADFTGIDPDPKVIAIAKRKLKLENVKADLKVAYGQKLPFKNSSFDVVISTLTFHHLDTDIKKRTAKEIFRVLKYGGKFLIADFGKPTNVFSSILLNIGSIFDGREQMRANLRGEIPVILKETGFEVREIDRYRGTQFLLGEKI